MALCKDLDSLAALGGGQACVIKHLAFSPRQEELFLQSFLGLVLYIDDRGTDNN